MRLKAVFGREALCRAAALVALAVLGGTPALRAAETGTLRVTVMDTDRLGIPGVTVSLSSPVLMGARSETTEATGIATFTRLAPGLYTVESVLDGFGAVEVKDVRVSVATTQTLDVTMRPKAEKTIEVTGDYDIVDTTSATGTTHVQVDRVEALPVGRDYVAYMQLVSGVNVVPNAQGVDTPVDPAGKGGLNYSDRSNQRASGGKGGSRDNIYYIDGVNITNLTTQTGALQFNNELIQEQEVISSGVPAEFAGGKGVVANIVTKSGGNEFSGSANIYAQPQGLVQEFSTADDRLHVPVDEKYDYAGTFGGPVMTDKAWFFGSAQKVDFSNSIELAETASATGESLPYAQDRTNYFGKVSLAPSQRDQFQVSGFLANRMIDGSRDPTVLPDRRFVADRQQSTFQAYYQRVATSSFIFDARYGRFAWNETQDPINPEAGAQNNVLFRAPTPPAYERQFGGFATASDNSAARNAAATEGEWNTDKQRLKFGFSFSRENDQDEVFFPEGYTLTSVESGLMNATLAEMVANSFINLSEVRDQVMASLNRNQDATTRAVDTNADGTVTLDEMLAVRFNTLNDHGLNFLGTRDVQSGSNDVKADRVSVYMQDDIQVHHNLTLNAGLRLEDNHYVNSEGGTIAHLKMALLPRIGASWDVTGDGRHKLSMFYGQYLDPLPFNMVHFAGDISGRVQNNEIFLDGAFYPYRVRGSAEHRDAVFVPNLEDSRSHELNATFEKDFGQGLVGSVNGYWRKDTNLIEDYDLNLYLTTLQGNPFFSHLALTPQDFGYVDGVVPEGANFFLSNLIGAERRYAGLDFDARKQFHGGSLVVAQYSFKSTRGNSQSDGDADLQGDFEILDPRNPWMTGRVPGTIDHQVKLFGTYRTKFGLDVGSLVYWNSGTAYTESDIFLPGQYNIYTNRVRNDEGTLFATTGALTNPSYVQVNLKLSYTRPFGAIKAQFFLDLYNLTNNQKGIELMAGSNDQLFAYGEATTQLSPRRAYLGARMNF